MSGRRAVVAAVLAACVAGMAASRARGGDAEPAGVDDVLRHAAAVTEGTLYVSPAGRDTWSGTRPEPNADRTDGPLATPHGARDRLRRLRREGLTGDATVLFRRGTYPLPDTLDFGPEDGGPALQIYRASGDEPVVFSGGVPLTAWEKLEDRAAGSVWRAAVPPGAPPVRWLVAGEHALPRARFPARGFVRIRAVDDEQAPRRFELDQRLPAGRVLSPHAEMADLACWTSRRERIAASGPDWVEGVTHLGVSPWSLAVARAGNPCFLENDPSFLTEPWHWCLDVAGDGILLLLPAGRDPRRLAIVAPVLERLVRVAGTGSEPVRNLRFQGIAFLHAAARLPAEGLSEFQAAFYSDQLSEKREPGRVDRLFTLPAAIDVSHAEGIEFCFDRFAQLGNHALNFGVGCRSCRLVGSEVHDVGATGVLVGAREVWGAGAAAANPQAGRGDWDDPAQAPFRVTIADNDIHDCGRMVPGGVGIWSGYTRFTTIAHNEVHHLPYTGISVGWSFDSVPTSAEHPLVEANHVHDVMRLLTDGGGIYLLGQQPGGVLRGNVVHDCWRHMGIVGFFAHGLYFDEGSRFWLVEDNQVYDTAHPVKFNNYLRNRRYDYVDADGRVVPEDRRIGGRDWITFGDNRFGRPPTRHEAGPRGPLRGRFERAAARRGPPPVPQPEEPVRRIVGSRGIANPGFEQPSLGGWQLLEGWGGGGGTLERVVDPGSAAGGRAFLRLRRTSYSDPVLSNAIAFERGTTYRLRAAVRLTGEAATTLRVVLESLGRELVADVRLEPGRWVTIDREFTLDDTLDSCLLFQSLDPASGTAFIDLDDVSVAAVRP